MTSWPTTLINIRSCRISAAYLGELDWGWLGGSGVSFFRKRQAAGFYRFPRSAAAACLRPVWDG